MYIHREASEAQVALLKTYASVDEAVTAASDAEQCIVDVIEDPEALILDHLLALAPVIALKGSLIYEVSDSVRLNLIYYVYFFLVVEDFC